MLSPRVLALYTVNKTYAWRAAHAFLTSMAAHSSDCASLERSVFPMPTWETAEMASASCDFVMLPELNLTVSSKSATVVWTLMPSFE